MRWRAALSARRLRSSSWRRRSSSSRWRARAASRSWRSRSTCSGALARLVLGHAARASASRSRASERARWRASFSSSDKRAQQHAAGRARGRWRGSRRRGARSGLLDLRLRGALNRRGSLASGPATRRLTSTTTCLERPCEKLWRTVLCSTGRFSVSVFGGLTVKVLSPGVLVSLIMLFGPAAFGPAASRSSGCRSELSSSGSPGSSGPAIAPASSVR